jgi:hypothetical protein
VISAASLSVARRHFIAPFERAAWHILRRWMCRLAIAILGFENVGPES